MMCLCFYVCVLRLQARTQQLLQQNRELLEHLASLGGYTYTENERAGLTSANISLAPQVPELQMHTHFYFTFQSFFLFQHFFISKSMFFFASKYPIHNSIFHFVLQSSFDLSAEVISIFNFVRLNKSVADYTFSLYLF